MVVEDEELLFQGMALLVSRALLGHKELIE
jgi:hypothetical protein